MEEIKAYIESGILELYVLGDLSADERLQVEAMALKYPVIKAEIAEIEKAMELYAELHDVEPSDRLKNRVLNSMVTNLGDDRTFRSKTDTQQPGATIKPLPPSKSINFYKYGFAACLALLVISVGALVAVYQQLQTSKSQVIALQSQNQKFTRQVSYMTDELSMFRDSTFQVIHLKGTPKTPASALTVAWSPKKKKVMLDMNNASLPQTDKAHQYQLWAIADGKPVDLGVFDMPDADSAKVKQMKDIGQAQAFAVTIEPAGGSVNPTMDAMVVITKL